MEASREGRDEGRPAERLKISVLQNFIHNGMMELKQTAVSFVAVKGVSLQQQYSYNYISFFMSFSIGGSTQTLSGLGFGCQIFPLGQEKVPGLLKRQSKP